VFTDRRQIGVVLKPNRATQLFPQHPHQGDVPPAGQVGWVGKNAPALINRSRSPDREPPQRLTPAQLGHLLGGPADDPGSGSQLSSVTAASADDAAVPIANRDPDLGPAEIDSRDHGTATAKASEFVVPIAFSNLAAVGIPCLWIPECTSPTTDRRKKWLIKHKDYLCSR